MLLSPGHSPRGLSTPSPAPSLSTDEKRPLSLHPPSDSDLTASKRRRKSIVLDEDIYVASIEKIIERDFFPDIPKLRDRLDWIQAIRTSDPVLIRDAQLKILERRRLRKGGNVAEGSSIRDASVTPGLSFFRNTSVTPSFSEHRENIVTDEQIDSAGDGVVEDQINISLSLDEFLRRYTSEDNESFSKILEKVNKRREEKCSHLLEHGESETKERAKCVTDGYGTSDQPVSTLEGWKYTPKNLLMYYPADRGEAPLTQEDRALRLKALTKEISRSNTRFHGKALHIDSPTEHDSAEILYTPVVGATPIPVSRKDMDKGRKYDLEDLRKTPNGFYVESEKKGSDGYSFVKTPSPAPGRDESPFTTWGEIEGTPLRLEQEETPIDIGGSGNGPQFRIPLPPSRDVKAHSLSREAAKRLRERSKMFQKPPLPSPPVRGSGSPITPVFSSAARKFMRKAMSKSSKSSSIDESLRASYRSPRSVTPINGRSMSRLGR
ncbi:hypothetical protein M569_06220, partial [Genlisea aurea]